VTTGIDEPAGPLEQLEAEIAASSGGLRTAAVRSASVAGTVNIVVQVITLVVYLILARLAAPAVFGVFAAGSILQSFGEIFTESGMTAALLQRRDRVDAAAATALASTFVGGLVLALIALSLSPLVGLYFHNHQAGLIAAALSGYLVVNGVTGVPGTLLQRRFALRRWLVEPFATLFFGVGAGVGLAVGLGPWGLVIGWYASTVFRAMAFWALVGWRPQLRLVSWSMWRELASFARHVLASVLLGEAQRVTTTALIGRYLGPADLGRFRFGWRLATQATAPLIAANAYTIQPALVRLSVSPARARAAVLTSFRIVCLVAFPLGAVFIPLASVIAVLMLGEKWRGVGPILVALAPMAMATALASVSNEIFKAAGRPYLLPRMSAIAAVSSITFMVALVAFGAQGVAWAWSASSVLVGLYGLSKVPETTGVERRELMGAVLPPLASALLAAGVLLAFDRFIFGGHPHANLATLGRLAVDVLLGLGIYVALMLVFARATLREFLDTVAAIVARAPRRQVEAS
jgi:O-antigen/teichoic acid export membrane protein